jgi:hypothetical protein
MADIIPFPQRDETEILRFDERHAFGEIGGLFLSLVQEQDNEDSRLTLVLLGGEGGIYILQSFEPTPEGMELAKLAGDITLRALAAAHVNWLE